MATLKELADRTGYSPATISRILSGDPSLSVTAEARRKVLEEAGRLNYTAVSYTHLDVYKRQAERLWQISKGRSPGSPA